MWKGSLMLADFILSSPELFADSVALELGAGTGFASIVLSKCVKRVYVTDFDTKILQNCKENIERNKTHAEVRKLDWEGPWEDWPFEKLGKLPQKYCSSADFLPENEFDWNKNDREFLMKLKFILAADGKLYYDSF
jgi:predicted nicotinamide N-methyase